MGIGLTNPSYNLDISGSAPFHVLSTSSHLLGYFVGPSGVNDGYLSVLQGDAGGTAILGSTAGVGFVGSQAATDFTIRTNNTERVRIQQSTGYVGIGTTGPAAPLDISSVSALGSGTYGGGTNFLRLFAASGSTFSEQAIAFQEAGTNVGAKIAVKNRANGAYDIIFANRDTSSTTSTMNERMRITSDGNVGIGTTNPGVALDIGQKTDGLLLPGGSTTQRPASPVNGTLRYNSDSSAVEVYQNSVWNNVSAGGAATAGGSAGQVQFNGINNVLAGSSSLVWDNTNLRLGIGTTGPTAKLTVGAGNQIALVDNPTGWGSYGQVPNIVITDTADNPLSSGGWGYQQLAFNQQNGQQVWEMGWLGGGLGFKVNNGASEPLFLAQGGNVGIGTTNPRNLLDLGTSSGAGDAGRKLALYNDGTYFDGFSVHSGALGISSNKTAGANDDITILTSGNVGIRNTAPYTSLVLPSTSDLTGLAVTNADVAIVIGNHAGSDNQGSIQVRAGGSSSALGTTNYNLTLNPEGGNVSIGSTSANYKLDVNGTAGFQTTFYGNNKDIFDTGDSYLRLNQGSAFSSGIWLGSSSLRMQGGYFEVGSQGGAGEVEITGTSGDATNRITINGNSGANSWFNTGGNVGIGTTLPLSKLNVTGDGGNNGYGIDTARQAAAFFDNNTTLGSGIYQNNGSGLNNHSGVTQLGSWWHVINMHHQDDNGFNAQIAVPLSGSDNFIHYRTSSGGTWTDWMQVISANTSGSVGIGTTVPNSALQVAGEVQPGSSGASCTSSNAGAIRYAGGNSVDVCNGSNWYPLTLNTSSPSGTVVVQVFTSSTSWTVPSNWNNANNTIEVIGGGGSGYGNAAGGGGGGAYAKSVNVSLTAGATAYIGVGGAATNSWFNVSANSAPTSSSQGVLAAAGGGGHNGGGGTGGQASSCFYNSVAYSGGNGANGAGGAAGPHGAGNPASGTTGGSGDAGTGGSAGTGGASGVAGGNGTEWDGSYGGGGGGGAATGSGLGGNGGKYGGGGGGSAIGNYQGTGAQGIVIVTYTVP